jgi:hypothetical protein
VVWNQDREVMANRSDIRIKNKKREKKHTDRCGNTIGQKRHLKGRKKLNKKQELMYEDATNAERKCKVMPVVIGATRIVTKGSNINVEAIPAKHSIDSL